MGGILFIHGGRSTWKEHVRLKKLSANANDMFLLHFMLFYHVRFKIHSQDSFVIAYVYLSVCLNASKIPQKVMNGLKQTFLEMLMIEQATDDKNWWCSRFRRGALTLDLPRSKTTESNLLCYVPLYFLCLYCIYSIVLVHLLQGCPNYFTKGLVAGGLFFPTKQ